MVGASWAMTCMVGVLLGLVGCIGYALTVQAMRRDESA